MAYNYLQAMTDDIIAFINNEVNLDAVKENYSCLGEWGETLLEVLWTEDSVTGNASGSYTFNRSQAKEYVCDNIDILCDALREFGEPAENVARHFLDADWEWFDVSIRCYLLGQALDAAYEELGIDDDFFTTDDDDEEEG